MRILHLTWLLTGGGAERQLGYISRELHRRGHESVVGYATSGPGVWIGGAPTVRLSAAPRRPHDPRLISDVVRLIRTHRPDVLHTWILPMDVVGGLAAAITGVPWVLREPSVRELYGRRLKPRVRLAVARAAAGSIVANSAGGREYWRTEAPRVPGVVIRNIVPVDDVQSAGPGAILAAVASALHVGRLDRNKNVDVVLRACGEVMSRRPFVLELCGEGVERARLGSLASQLRITPRVTFPGFVTDVWRRVRAARVLLQVSSVEGAPNAVTEAFAAGTPVILSDIPGHREIADERMALFVPPHDVPATAAAIHAVLDDEEAARRRAARAAASISDRSIAAATAAYEDVYRTAIAGRRGSRQPAGPVAPPERAGPEHERG